MQLLVAYHPNGDTRESSIRDLSFNPRRKEALGAKDVGIGGKIRNRGARSDALSVHGKREAAKEHCETNTVDESRVRAHRMTSETVTIAAEASPPRRSVAGSMRLSAYAPSACVAASLTIFTCEPNAFW